MDASGSPSRKRKSAGLDPLEAAKLAAAAAEGRGTGPAAEDQEPPTMEMEAAGSPSKKRNSARIEPLEAGQPAAAAAEGRGPGPAAEDQEPPLLAAGGGGMDRITQLPDALLQAIISRLTTKEGGRTPLLASGWRNLWRSAPLNIDQDFWRSGTLNLDVFRRCIDGKNLADVVWRILSAHEGPCRHFCAPVYHLHGDRPATADAWLQSPALRNLQELELCGFQSGLPYQFTMGRPSPAAAFRFSETLCVATFGNCQFPDITAHAIHFPKLKKLVLEHVSSSESSLNTIIAGCLALECLLIACCEGFSCVRINSISLRSIYMKFHRGKLIIENAPCLERLLQYDSYHPHTSVISRPKLETLGCIPAYFNPRLMFGSTVIQAIVDTRIPEVPTVKILSVDMGVLSLDATIDLIRCFPCLERLYIKCPAQGGQTNVWRGKHRVLLESFDIRLKNISLRYYMGTKSHVNFATFFVENDRVLELMTFEVYHRNYNEEFIAQQREVLRLDKKVSRGAQIRFTLDGSYRDTTYFGLNDLDLADPFERKDPYQYIGLS